MHHLIDAESVANINNTGCYSTDFPDRIPIFEKYGLPYDREAENAIVTGCQILSLLPHVLVALSRYFERKGFSYTFLSREYCCGNYLYRPAIKERDEEAMNECRDLSRGFVAKTLKFAEGLGVRRLVIFCSPCYPVYKHAFPEKDIIFYPQAIEEVMTPGAYRKKIDYYAGCYKLHKRFAPVPMDLGSTNRVFEKLDGLELNRIKAPNCCFKPDGLSYMLDNIQTDEMVHICTGCYGQALRGLPEGSNVRVRMLPEFIEEIDR